ncbi:MAG: putative peptide transport system permease protein [Frankiales bacterium]|nr:putative peptide transport system permease protein [Frankiales bacterium]
MTRFLIRRVLFGGLVLLIVSLAVFILFFVASDPAAAFCGRTCTPERLELVKSRLGLDRSYVAQYLSFLGNLLQGDLGYSFASQRSVNEKIAEGLPATASLAFGSAILWLLMGIPIGITAATKPRSIRDRLATLFALTGLSLPSFVVGLVLLNVLFYQLTIRNVTWFPPSGYVPLTENPAEWARHLLLPWFTLAFVTAASYARLTRGSMLEVLGEDYIRTARAKGLPERQVVYRHGLRSALTPIVTLLGIDVGTLLGGTVVTEQLFGLQGIGQSALQAVNGSDLPVVLGTVLIAALFIVVANILVDIVYAMLDARVRLA